MAKVKDILEVTDYSQMNVMIREFHGNDFKLVWDSETGEEVPPHLLEKDADSIWAQNWSLFIHVIGERKPAHAYKVSWQEIQEFCAVVEADSEEEAYEIARNEPVSCESVGFVDYVESAWAIEEV